VSRAASLLLMLALLGGEAHARSGGSSQLAAGRGADARAQTSDGTVILRTPGPAELLIRGGVFNMGSDIPAVATAQAACRHEPLRSACDATMFADEMVAHEIMLSDFWIDRTEVTNAAYDRCVAAGACTAPAYGAARNWNARSDWPVTLVSWYDGQAYCRWRGARLPTEAEWERVARGWSDRLYPWGNVFNPKICNHGRFAISPIGASDDRDGFSELAPVGSFPQGRSPEGVFDLAGNVEEWVSDWYAPHYAEAEMVDPSGPATGDFKVARGGSFLSGRPWLRTTARAADLPSARRAWRGFRCARSRRNKLPTTPTPAGQP
jgi:sulfatase modifying factor 1